MLCIEWIIVHFDQASGLNRLTLHTIKDVLTFDPQLSLIKEALIQATYYITTISLFLSLKLVRINFNQ